MIKTFLKNELGKDFVVGDIHGCFGKLEEQLIVAGFDPERGDRLFSVGDLVDRGPESERCIEFLQKPWFHAVRGNHEQLAIDYMKGFGDPFTYSMNGGGWFLAMDRLEQRKYVAYFESLPHAIQVQTDEGMVGIVHAEVPQDDWHFLGECLIGERTKSFEHLERFMLWSRDLIRGRSDFEGVANVRKVYVGHTPCKQVTTLKNVHYIDTGAVFGGQLTIVEL